MVSVCAANYLQRKEFYDFYESVLYLVFLYPNDFMTQFLYGEEKLLFCQYENMEKAGAINRNSKKECTYFLQEA